MERSRRTISARGPAPRGTYSRSPRAEPEPAAVHPAGRAPSSRVTQASYIWKPGDGRRRDRPSQAARIHKRRDRRRGHRAWRSSRSGRRCRVDPFGRALPSHAIAWRASPYHPRRSRPPCPASPRPISLDRASKPLGGAAAAGLATSDANRTDATCLIRSAPASRYATANRVVSGSSGFTT